MKATSNIEIFSLSNKIQDYGLLMKFKLSLTVVFSAVMAYLIAAESTISWAYFTALFLGGFFTTGAANALNQVLEKDYDKLMKRTENRPLATGRMTSAEGILVAGISSLIGVTLLAVFNPTTAFLGMVSLILYAFVYTPLKRVSNINVFIGAIPGALPMLIGCTAAQNGTVTGLGTALFTLQFVWQFIHFLAIAWLGDEDYKNAGFYMLPSKNGEKDKTTGLHSIFHSLILVPVSWMPYFLGVTGITSAVILTLLALGFLYCAVKLYRECSREAARKQMFFSLVYLPIALLALFFDKI
ncbi:MAG: heme o synthase [Saprospiraceae bacterium]|nr:heme o synthase [Saprospiraceae bacterium]